MVVLSETFARFRSFVIHLMKRYFFRLALQLKLHALLMSKSLQCLTVLLYWGGYFPGSIP